LPPGCGSARVVQARQAGEGSRVPAAAEGQPAYLAIADVRIGSWVGTEMGRVMFQPRRYAINDVPVLLQHPLQLACEVLDYQREPFREGCFIWHTRSLMVADALPVVL